MRAKREEEERKRLEEALRARQEEERKRLEEEELARQKQVELFTGNSLNHSFPSVTCWTNPVFEMFRRRL